MSPNQAATKLSPDHALSPQQQTLKEKILAFCARHRHGEKGFFIIEGTAGTGKSLVLNNIFREIQKSARLKNTEFSGTKNYLVVNHPEMLKLYRNISENIPELQKSDYERPTTLINRLDKNAQKADIVLIDEAHLLLTRPDRYNKFEQNNQLEEILRLAQVVIIVYDTHQVLKFKSHWNSELLAQFHNRATTEIFHLDGQFRMQANKAVRDWIAAFCRQKILPLSHDPHFDLRIFDDAQEMYEQLKSRNAQDGLSRILATYDYPYRLDGHDYFIHEGRFRLRWDRAHPQARLPWAERPDTIDEVGSVYTIQGFDLNYAAIILGPSLGYDTKADKITVDPTRYEDGAAFAGRDGIAHAEHAKQTIMLNALNVLMTRGMKGLYLYASNPALREQIAEATASRSNVRENKYVSTN
ncbi:DUF2075 domain-containing protein [Kozakia baliensis]|uniref:DUF2075 domain-containing protein n=1 Tax=Kozakia baliensis TaxID=153496 RepID=UPI000495827D|nr:DUF2075 domain-containing protein [Kozakia baliensis]